MEIYNQIKDEDWSLVGTSTGNNWPRLLWNFDKAHRWNGGSGGGGIGYTLPASLGAALANKQHGRLTVSIGGDGDFNFAPGTLWTAAHHRIRCSMSCSTTAPLLRGQSDTALKKAKTRPGGGRFN